MTDKASITKMPPMIAYIISSLKIIARVASIAPRDSEPTSPMKICAGYELYHKKPSPEPTIALAKIAVSETWGKYGISR